MVKKAEVSSQITKEDTENVPKKPVRSYEMTQKALRRKKVSPAQLCHIFYVQNKKQKQEAKKERATQEEMLLRESAINQIAGA